MSENINPYAAPLSIERQASTKRRFWTTLDWYAIGSWPFVFAINLVIPGFFGSFIMEPSAIGGAVVAVAVLFGCTLGLCVAYPRFARRFILGAALCGLTQLFPMLQMLSGIVALEIAEKLQLVTPDKFGTPNEPLPGTLGSVMGGFVVTALVGIMLLGFSGVIGSGVSFVMPAKWFNPTLRATPLAE